MKNKVQPAQHPRPSIIRDTEYMLLDGVWNFRFDDENIGVKNCWYEKFPKESQNIVVPFSYETQASTINNTDRHDILWYSRKFVVTPSRNKKILLHFNAVDFEAQVWVNGVYMGNHKGGYVPFSFDITDYINIEENTLVVRCYDSIDCSQPRGKQTWQGPFGCWYHATSGIWQSVWIEEVGNTYIQNIKITPNIDEGNIKCEVLLDKALAETNILYEISFDQKICTKSEMYFASENKVLVHTINIDHANKLDNIHYWSPEFPNLYDLKVSLVNNTNIIDSILTYFGMRKVSVRGNKILLNNAPYYQRLILDQGYWEESGLTPPGERALIDDIMQTKAMGFNGARKHQKIEDSRYYYWADRLGLLVWGELPSAYHFNHLEMKQLTTEMIDFIERDYNHPSIVAWVPLNESWGVRNIASNSTQLQFARGLYHLIKSLDTTRIVSTNDGWEMLEDSDIIGIHDYEPSAENFKRKTKKIEHMLKCDVQGRLLFADGEQYQGQPLLMSEFGGIAFAKDTTSDNWGYHGNVDNEKEFLDRFESIVNAIIDDDNFFGFCYTQLTDVFQEVNGLLDMQRNPKVDLEKIKAIISRKNKINLDD